jgi:UDP-GlcNAc3NAcA epimerase
MKIVTVVGARPQFMKACMVSRQLSGRHDEILIHTGQHYDRNMSDVFFDELEYKPKLINLDLRSGSHAEQTGMQLIKVEEILYQHRPDCVIVYGDTNSTLAGALAAVKLHIPVVHIEAGMRNYDRKMPEEVNRVLADHCADLLLCSGQVAIENLRREGIVEGVHWIGDVLVDALDWAARLAESRRSTLSDLGLEPDAYLLTTIHRAENTDDPRRLRGILEGFARSEQPIVFPVHPRTRKMLAGIDVYAPNVQMIDPVGFLDMVVLERHARVIMTDSGGVQREAYWLGVPCVTTRDTTEWVETVRDGFNTLTGADPDRIARAIADALARPKGRPAPGAVIVNTELYGDPNAAQRCVEQLDRLSDRALSAQVS